MSTFELARRLARAEPTNSPQPIGTAVLYRLVRPLLMARTRERLVLVAHNHPDGEPQPSSSDITTTVLKSATSVTDAEMAAGLLCEHDDETTRLRRTVIAGPSGLSPLGTAAAHEANSISSTPSPAACNRAPSTLPTGISSP